MFQINCYLCKTYFSVCRWLWEFKTWWVHENSTVIITITVNVIKQRCEWLLQVAADPRDVTVAGGLGRHTEGHPTLG